MDVKIPMCEKDWDELSCLFSEDATWLLENNLDKAGINWCYLSAKSSSNAAIQLLEKNPDKIVWSCLSLNAVAP